MSPSHPAARDRPIEPAPTATAAVVGTFSDGPFDRPVAVESAADLESVFGAGGATAAAVRQFFEEGGKRLYVSRPQNPPDAPPGDPPGAAGSPLAAALAGDRARQTGFFALDRAPGFGLLFLPEAATLPDDEAACLAAAATRYAEERRAFYVGELPRPEAPSAAHGEVAAALAWLERFPEVRHPNAALFAPRPLAAGVDGSPTPVSGAIAGLYARTDLAQGVWKAPAGQEAVLETVPALAAHPTASEIDALARGGVNALRHLPGQDGIVVWGARTLVGGDRGATGTGSEWKYVAVRRLALFVEQSLATGLGWVVFEPNDEPLWKTIRARAEELLHGLFRQGAFPASKPEEAYFVRVDRTTITQADIDAGIVNILIAIAPLRPAEFIILHLQQLAGQERP